MPYEGTIELIGGIKQKNNNTFPLVDSKDVYYEDNKRLYNVVNTLETQMAQNMNDITALDNPFRIISNISDLPNTNQNCMYIVSSTNKWYYWDSVNSEYTVGGEAASIQVDTTLTTAGAAADAKATGDEIERLDERISYAACFAGSISDCDLDYITGNGVYRIASTTNDITNLPDDYISGKQAVLIVYDYPESLYGMNEASDVQFQFLMQNSNKFWFREKNASWMRVANINELSDIQDDLLNRILTTNTNLTDISDFINSVIMPVIIKNIQPKNLFWKHSLKYNIFINYNQNYNEYSNNSYHSSDFIQVKPSTKYIIRFVSYLYFYDNSKNAISSSSLYKNHYMFETPENCYYIRFSNNITSSANLNNTINNIIAEADDYDFILNCESDSNVPTLFELLENMNKKPLNLINSLVQGYIKRTDGTLTGTSGQYRTSNLIKIDTNKYYYWYNLRANFGGFYKSDGTTYIQMNSRDISLSNPFRASDYFSAESLKEVYYIRVSGYGDHIGLYEREIQKYEDINKKYYDEKYINLNAPVKLNVFFPEHFYVNKDRIIEIYNDTLIPNPDSVSLYFDWDSDIGRCYKRKIVITSSTTGTFPLKLTIYDKWYNVLYKGESSIHVVGNIQSTKTIIPIGDSITNGKPWLNYITELNSKITFTGTRWHGTGSNFNAEIKHEGRSGWRASHYISNTSYSYENDGLIASNPFFDPTNNKFSWNYYKSTYFGDTNIDAVQFFLGTNGLNLAPSTEVNAIFDMVNDILNTNSNMKIFICYPLYSGNQDACGKQTNNDGYVNVSSSGDFQPMKKLAMWNFFTRIYAKLKDELDVNLFNNICFIPVAQTFDHEYMFGSMDVNVNQYSAITEKMPVDSIHPNDYHQFVDIMYAAYCYKLGG